MSDIAEARDSRENPRIPAPLDMIEYIDWGYKHAIGYDSGYHFDFEISTEYAGVSGKDNFEINIRKEKSSEKYYSGYYGKANSGNRVSITSDYGGISFYQN